MVTSCSAKRGHASSPGAYLGLRPLALIAEGINQNFFMLDSKIRFINDVYITNGFRKLRFTFHSFSGFYSVIELINMASSGRVRIDASF